MTHYALWFVYHSTCSSNPLDSIVSTSSKTSILIRRVSRALQDIICFTRPGVPENRNYETRTKLKPKCKLNYWKHQHSIYMQYSNSSTLAAIMWGRKKVLSYTSLKLSQAPSCLSADTYTQVWGGADAYRPLHALQHSAFWSCLAHSHHPPQGRPPHWDSHPLLEPLCGSAEQAPLLEQEQEPIYDWEVASVQLVQ